MADSVTHESATDRDRGPNGESKGGSTSSSAKKNACMICRRRKLKCDGSMPACGTCARLGHECAYVESRRKSGPRRGYVKGLENRLAQVEELLKPKEDAEINAMANSEFTSDTRNGHDHFEDVGTGQPYLADDDTLEEMSLLPEFDMYQKTTDPSFQPSLVGFPFVPINSFCWEVMETGVEEPLPPQDVTDELTEIYFSKVHPQIPFIHQYRFLASMNLSPRARPQIGLRYAMWMLAASCTKKYEAMHPHFYARAKKYAEADERAGRQKYAKVRHAQTFALIAKYEYKMMIFPNAWLTTGRATRLAQMMGLHRLDGLGMDVMQTLPAAVDWTEEEERRRTFWLIFAMDRHGSCGTGWPMIVDERDILTNLPSSEEAFLQGDETPGICLNNALNSQHITSLSALSGSILIACFYGRILDHVQRPDPNNDDNNMNGSFWKNHRKLDSMLLNTLLYLPSHLRMPGGHSNPNIIYLNMALHAAVICLHQAAISKAEKLDPPGQLIVECRERCLAAASEIASVMKRCAHMDLVLLHGFTPFTIFVATRIFSRVCKSEPFNDEVSSSVRFLLSALVAIKETNPLAESYLVQLDLEGTGLVSLQENSMLFEEIEKSVAGISLNDKSDDAPWVKFVSPLVRIVEQTEESILTSFTSAPNTSSGSREMSLGIGSADSGMSVFVGQDQSLLMESWGLSESELTPDLYESLMTDLGGSV